MRAKKFDAVEMKRRLQKETEQKLSELSEKEQLELLSKKYGHLKKTEESGTRRLTPGFVALRLFEFKLEVAPCHPLIIGMEYGRCGWHSAKP